MDNDPSKRTFGNLHRGADGKFSDDHLARILTESVEDVAGNYPIAPGSFSSKSDNRRFLRSE